MQNQWAVVGWGSVWVLVVGCADWPTFANKDEDALIAPVGSVDLTFVAAETDEFTDDPRDLRTVPLETVGGAFKGLWWSGSLGWSPAVIVGAETFFCENEILGELPLTYQGDVDFFYFEHTGGSLCMTVAPQGPVPGEPPVSESCLDDANEDGLGTPMWEMPLFHYNEESSCPTGHWLNQESDQADSSNLYPEPYGLTRRGLFFPRLEPGIYVTYLASVCGAYPSSAPASCPNRDGDPDTLGCVDYNFGVALVPTEEACNDFHEQLSLEVAP